MDLKPYTVVGFYDDVGRVQFVSSRGREDANQVDDVLNEIKYQYNAVYREYREHRNAVSATEPFL
jgi:hypothetical protein